MDILYIEMTKDIKDQEYKSVEIKIGENIKFLINLDQNFYQKFYSFNFK